MKEIKQRYFIFKKKVINFVDYPFDVNGCDYVLIPFCKSYMNIEGFECTEQLTSIIDLTSEGDTVWNKIGRSTRHDISKAQKMGIEVKINENYDEFYEIFKKFTKSKGISPIFKYDFEILKEGGTLFTYEYNGEILGGNFYLEDEKNIRLLLSCSSRLQVDKEIAKIISKGNRLAHWQAIKYAKDKGISCLDLGGLWPEDIANSDPQKKSINLTKMQFGGNIVTYYNYEKVYSLPLKVLFSAYKTLRNTE